MGRHKARTTREKVEVVRCHARKRNHERSMGISSKLFDELSLCVAQNQLDKWRLVSVFRQSHTRSHFASPLFPRSVFVYSKKDHCFVTVLTPERVMLSYGYDPQAILRGEEENI
ncbi:MAG: hypothetical protein ACRC1W_01525 [Shewanella sp.]